VLALGVMDTEAQPLGMSINWTKTKIQDLCRPPSWIFAGVKFGGISVSATSVLVSEPNFVRICAIATELWPFKSRSARIYLQTKFGEDISKGGRVMAVYVFSKWRPPPSSINFRCRFSSYGRFYIVALYVLAKFDKSTSFCG